ncbi:MAG TPA: cobalt-precorrin-5B (C(1))-methyltransferase [Azospirillaceae bacterium]|nr:cobalt-precorrin-5B (C(1))-methyltransferase [Azospirillaceae bacterium]
MTRKHDEGVNNGEDTLRRGWTTGACATACAKAAYAALVTGSFPDPVVITLPRGEQPAFALARQSKGEGWAMAAIVKDAGDDPDVTHGALIVVTVRFGSAGSGVTFQAGPGVGTVTRPGLPIPPGEPAINPVPRQMIRDVVAEVATAFGASGDVTVEISVPHGERLAARTWNPRLGIVGGLSILGTTGIVVPFSCSAWIHSIQRGVDVARAGGLTHIAGATGSTSEKVAQALHALPEMALIDMGDFAGGLLKYLRKHPVPRLTLAGGFAKMTKLSQGFLDLHSGRSQVDFVWLADRVADLGAPDLTQGVRAANTANHVLTMAKERALPLAQRVAALARSVALNTLDGAPVDVEVVVVDRQGMLIGRAGFEGDAVG